MIECEEYSKYYVTNKLEYLKKSCPEMGYTIIEGDKGIDKIICKYKNKTVEFNEYQIYELNAYELRLLLQKEDS